MRTFFKQQQRHSTGSMSAFSLVASSPPHHLSDDQSESISTDRERTRLSTRGSSREHRLPLSPPLLPLLQKQTTKTEGEEASPRFLKDHGQQKSNDIPSSSNRKDHNLLLPSENVNDATPPSNGNGVTFSRFTQMGSLQQYFSKMK